MRPHSFARGNSLPVIGGYSYLSWLYAGYLLTLHERYLFKPSREVVNNFVCGAFLCSFVPPRKP